MELKKIILHHFRNYEEQEIELSSGINVFYGNNAQGKTNLLEAVFLCSMGKSFRTKKEKELIHFKKEEASVIIHYEKKDREGETKVNIAEKKTFSINQIPIKKLSEVLGNIHIVLFSPEDILLFKGNPSGRRKFLDMLISQLRPAYVYQLNQYVKAIEQRNCYLKQIKQENKPEEILDIWDEKIAELGEKIYQYRLEFIEKIKDNINEVHQKVTKEKEVIEITYESHCYNEEDFLKNLKKERKNDIFRTFTGIGIHRDDFSLTINGQKINRYGSQGQNRTAILSLKLTELQIMQEEIGESPILLLDDFMSELDKERRENFLENIEQSQVLLTCTDNILLPQKKTKTFYVEKGSVKEE